MTKLTKKYLEACMIVYHPRETIYRRYTKFPIINRFIKWYDKHILKDGGKLEK